VLKEIPKDSAGKILKRELKGHGRLRDVTWGDNSGIMNTCVECAMGICSYSFEEFVEKVRAFHGFEAPGVIIGGYMVDLAYRYLPPNGAYDALCETPKCLPDAIQLLTPCSIGNGWLVVINTGRYALILYDKVTGEGVRVFVDTAKVDGWPEIRDWYFRTKPKKEKKIEDLLHEIREAGSAICSVQAVRVSGRFLGKKHRGAFAVCPVCRESYPAEDGPLCLGCKDGDICVVVSPLVAGRQ